MTPSTICGINKLPEPEKRAMYARYIPEELVERFNGQIQVLLYVLNNPASPRFDVDRMSDGSPTPLRRAQAESQSKLPSSTASRRDRCAAGCDCYSLPWQPSKNSSPASGMTFIPSSRSITTTP